MMSFDIEYRKINPSSHTSDFTPSAVHVLQSQQQNVYAVFVFCWLSINSRNVRNFCWDLSGWNKLFLLPQAFLLMLAVIHRMNKITTSRSHHSCKTICLARRDTSVTCCSYRAMIIQVQPLKVYHSCLILFIYSVL